MAKNNPQRVNIIAFEKNDGSVELESGWESVPGFDDDSTENKATSQFSCVYKKRQNFTYADDVAILNYIVSKNLYMHVKGNAMWNDLAKSKKLEHHTEQSMKERFRRHILVRINQYKLEKEVISKFLASSKISEAKSTYSVASELTPKESVAVQTKLKEAVALKSNSKEAVGVQAKSKKANNTSESMSNRANNISQPRSKGALTLEEASTQSIEEELFRRIFKTKIGDELNSQNSTDPEDGNELNSQNNANTVDDNELNSKNKTNPEGGNELNSQNNSNTESNNELISQNKSDNDSCSTIPYEEFDIFSSDSELQNENSEKLKIPCGEHSSLNNCESKNQNSKTGKSFNNLKSKINLSSRNTANTKLSNNELGNEISENSEIVNNSKSQKSAKRDDDCSFSEDLDVTSNCTPPIVDDTQSQDRVYCKKYPITYVNENKKEIRVRTKNKESSSNKNEESSSNKNEESSSNRNNFNEHDDEASQSSTYNANRVRVVDSRSRCVVFPDNYEGFDGIFRTKKACCKVPVLKKMNPYCEHEDIEILEFIVKGKFLKNVAGNEVWKEFGKVSKTGRSWHSARGRFLKVILGNLDKYNIEQKTKEKLLKACKYRRNSAFTPNHNTSASGSGRPFNRTKLPYTRREDLKIMEYVIRNRRYKEIKGKSMFEGMSAAYEDETDRRIFHNPPRTWESLKQRLREYIIYNPKNYPEVDNKYKRRLFKYGRKNDSHEYPELEANNSGNREAEINRTPQNQDFSEINKTPENRELSEINKTPENRELSEINKTPENRELSEINKTPENRELSEINKTPENRELTEINKTPENRELSEINKTPENRELSEINKTPKNRELETNVQVQPMTNSGITDRLRVCVEKISSMSSAAHGNVNPEETESRDIQERKDPTRSPNLFPSPVRKSPRLITAVTEEEKGTRPKSVAVKNLSITASTRRISPKRKPKDDSQSEASEYDTAPSQECISSSRNKDSTPQRNKRVFIEFNKEVEDINSGYPRRSPRINDNERRAFLRRKKLQRKDFKDTLQL